MIFDTLTVNLDGAVPFVEISAPSMTLPGPELVRDPVTLIVHETTTPTDLLDVYDARCFAFRSNTSTPAAGWRHEQAGCAA